MPQSKMESRIWKAVACAGSMSEVLDGLADALREGGIRELQWLGEVSVCTPWAWNADTRTLSVTAPKGGLIAIIPAEGPLPERLGALLAEALTVAARLPAAHADGANAARLRSRLLPDEVLVGAETGLSQVMQRVEMVAKQDVPVLLLGETGTGKEVVARAVHARSRRAGRPFVRVNCGAIPRDLVDSELFGHERGGFTGAVERRLGWFERADGGTLLLDEIGELSLAAQVRLLRILQDGSFSRVGGGKPLTVDVRIIAATHRDLPGMVDRGEFREDLWYRIATFPIRIPALRERKEDIAGLARHFVHKAAVRFGLPEPELSFGSMRSLQEYSWPGNIRELGAVIDRAMILGEGKRLELDAALGLGTGPSRAFRQLGAQIEAKPGASKASQTEDLTLDVVQKRHIESVLTMCHGRVEGPFGAAAVLRINPHTLRSRMRKLGIEWAAFRTSTGESPKET